MRVGLLVRLVCTFCLLTADVSLLRSEEPTDGAAQASSTSTRSGEELVKENCMQCHRSDNPKYPDHNAGWVFGKRYSHAGWKDNIDRMEKIALADQYISEPWSAGDKEKMVKYLAEQTTVLWSQAQSIGMFHFSVVHFPIALVNVVVLFEALGWMFGWPIRRDWVHGLLFLTVISAAVAAGLGLLLISEMTASLSEDLSDHRTAGLATVGISLAALLLRELAIRTKSGTSQWAYRLVLLLAAAAAGAAGHLGGVLVHGEFLNQWITG
jgi:uncharacterized membrane protein